MGPASNPSNSNDESQAFRFPKLNGQNYTIWAGYIKCSLQTRYLWLIVNGTETCPTKPANTRPADQTEAEWNATKRDYLDWMQRDQAAQGLMLGAAEPSQWPHVNGKETAKEIWEAWEEHYVRNQQHIDVHYYFEELHTRKFVDGMEMLEHVVSMLGLGQKIVAAGETLPDLHVARALILSLPRESPWDLIKTKLYSLEPAELTSNYVGSILIAEHNHRKREKASETVLLASKSDGEKKRRKKKGDGNGPKPDDECRYCHAKGHWINKCPKREEDEKQKKAGGSQAENYTSSV